MPLFEAPQRRFAELLSDWALANPFDVQWHRDAERRLNEMVQGGALEGLAVPDPVPVAGRPLVSVVIAGAVALAHRLRDGLAAAPDDVSPEDYRLYTDVANTVLYFGYRDRLQHVLERGLGDDGEREVECYRDFEADWRHFFGFRTPYAYPLKSAAHAFASFFQVRRAYSEIERRIVGNSKAVGRLRADVWHSIFTYDFHRHGRLQFDRMHEVSTLITGPSGTGKELVAKAIGLSRHIPFDPRSRRFTAHFVNAFHTVHIAALAETLLESELFGHAKGAFTDATSARVGWFEKCEKPLDSVFLDEIGEVSPGVQVKLLRVLQDRTFQRLGETRTKAFNGKLLAATNRDLAEEVESGRFREDLYYRLCADVVRTPSLGEQVADDPAELDHLVRHVARGVVGDEHEAELLAVDVLKWIDGSLGRDYGWPGNFRELEQCVKNVLVRNEYVPLRRTRSDAATNLASEITRGELTLDEICRRYCCIVHDREGSFAAAARRLGIDQRTVKRHVE